LTGKQHQRSGLRIDQICKLPGSHFNLETTWNGEFSVNNRKRSF
jgi:hypothetical protein